MDSIILTTEEVDEIVRELEPSNLEEIGNKQWFKKRQAIIKIYQMAMLQARSNQSELVKDSVLKNNKINYFVNELIILQIWKNKILSEMLKMTPVPEYTFPTYMTLYHEGMMVGLLQILLFHGDVCGKLNEIAIDIADYAVAQLQSLDPSNPPPVKEDVNRIKTGYDVIKSQRDVIAFNVSAQCLSILRYIAENLEELPLIVTSRLYSVHDVPLLVTQLLCNNTWLQVKDGCLWKYCDTCWREWYEDDPPLSTTECQAWLLIYQLITHPNCLTSYQLTSYRKEQLNKLNNLLHERVTDMLSPLKDLKAWLSRLLVDLTPSNIVDKPLVIEMEESLREKYLKQYENRFITIAKEHAKRLFYGDPNEIQELASTMSNTFDMMDDISDQIRTCSNCFLKANKKCSKCKRVWYCSRECQVQHWKAHKNICCQ